MITAGAVATIIAYLFAGSVLHRAAAARLLRLDGVKIGAGPGISDRDILFLGLLPALAIIGTIGTYLGLFHVLRADTTILLIAVTLLLLWRDTMATLRALGSLAADGWRALRSLDLLTLGAVAGFFMVATFLFVLAQLPSGNVDVWVFQFPLAQSIADHAGFVYPQIDHIFYGSNPLFFNLLYGQALLFVDHFIAADAVNIAIYPRVHAGGTDLCAACAGFGLPAHPLFFCRVDLLCPGGAGSARPIFHARAIRFWRCCSPTGTSATAVPTIWSSPGCWRAPRLPESTLSWSRSP